MKKTLNRKYLKIGSFSITMTAVVIAVVIVLNLFLAELPTTYTKFDLSSLNLYAIGDETKAIMDGVNDDVTFYLLAQRGTEDAVIEEMLERYAAMCPKITVKTVDPITNPAFVGQYTTEALSDNSVIAVSGKRSYCVDYYDIYTTEYSEEEIYNYYYYGQMPKGTSYFSGELAFTTALDYVTRDDLPTAYTLTGHGETALTDTYETYIGTENIARVKDFSLLTVDQVPDDATTVILNLPTSDISADECEMLKQFLDQGGSLVLITGAVSYQSAAMPNLTELCAYMGLEPVDGIVLETDRNHYMMNAHYLIPTLGSTSKEPLSLLSNSQIYVLANAAHGILSDGSHDVTPLLKTSSGAYVKADIAASDLSKADGDVEGVMYIGAAVTGDADGSRSDRYKFVWFSSPGITDESADLYVSGGNSSMFMACLNWMSENKTELSILSKQLAVEALTITEAQAGIWSVVVTVIIPLAVFALGFVVWFRRRKK